ncbi:hypothetical protein DFQ30_003501 [Apophysomyces sp. BC1015]|nr:hypothetical protein DFQ30_003501 [Apophysomyces sp. BC1015]KAG0179962.1 hypothetical protein DFQ29_001439 [Apophysomyces sp. BC1021]
MKYAFTNLVRTDGHAIEVIFAKKAPEQPPIPVSHDGRLHRRRLGQSSCVTQLFIAEDEQFRVTQFTNAEWCAKSGHRKRQWNQQIRKADAGITALECSLPTHKTARPTK